MAFNSLRSNKLRAGLTLLSMSIGVFAIVGVAAAVGALDNTVNEQLISLGQNDIIVQKNEPVEMGNNVNRVRRPNITLRQATELKKRLSGVEQTGLFTTTNIRTVKLEEETAEVNLLYGADETFTDFLGFNIESGRTFDPQEIQFARDVVIVGADVAADLDLSREDLGTAVRIDGYRYTVIGILKAKGAIMGQAQDDLVVVPISSAAKHFFSRRGHSIEILVRALDNEHLEETIDQIIGHMRAIRRLQVTQENDFEVISQEEVVDTVVGFTKYITFFGLFCGVIALLAAGVGIMNIMLVSVKERTKEIGIRKAVGATRGNIMVQFIVEAVTLCQIGAAIGIFLGVVVGLLLGLALSVTPAFPWTSILVSTSVCLFIGILFGAYPAWQAARLDPIEALRYE